MSSTIREQCWVAVLHFLTNCTSYTPHHIIFEMAIGSHRNQLFELYFYTLKLRVIENSLISDL